MTTDTEYEPAVILELSAYELGDLVSYLRRTADIPSVNVPPIVCEILEMSEAL